MFVYFPKQLGYSTRRKTDFFRVEHSTGRMVSLASSPESGEMRRTKSSRGRSPRSRSRSRSSTPKSISKSLSKGSSSRSRSSSRSLPSRRFRARRPTGRARGKARSASGGSRGSRSRSASEEYYYYKGRSPGDDSTNSTVFVGGMSASTDERSLREFFQKFGTVVETKVEDFCLFSLIDCVEPGQPLARGWVCDHHRCIVGNEKLFGF